MKICVICKEPIGKDFNGWEGGANAAPVAEGKCCEQCDNSVVTYKRLLDAGFSKRQATVAVLNRHES